MKFSVYNAGSRPITVTRGDRLFSIWYASLDQETSDGYGVAGPQQDKISSDDQNVMHGEIASPAELKSRIDELKHFDIHRKWMLGVIAAAVAGIFVRLCFMSYFSVPTSADIDRLKQELATEIRAEFLEANKNTPATTVLGAAEVPGDQPQTEDAAASESPVAK